MKNVNLLEKKGITLIALAITIIVILILAGVTISYVFSDGGLIDKAKEASNAMNNAVINDQASINGIGEFIEEEGGLKPKGNITFGEIVWNNNKAEVTISTDTEYTIQYQINSKDGEWKELENNGKVTDLSYKDIVYARLKDDGRLGDIVDKTVEDTLEPTVTVKVGNKTENSIDITVEATDGQSGLAETETYTYFLGDEQRGVDTDSTYTYTGLTAGTKYIVRVNVKDKAGNIGTGEVETASKVSAPTSWTLIGTYSSSGSFTIPEDGYFKIACGAASGRGGTAKTAYARPGADGQYDGYNDGYGGGGGGSGGYAESSFYKNKGDVITFSVGGNVSCEGITVTSGGAGGNASSSSSGGGGSAGSAAGGNLLNVQGQRRKFRWTWV